ncbi:MAG: hypothetical protein B9S33_19150 [Pedosphaera sp. Tous-C6FEB]|nr:MAG: hypothetical protein B9S33_19150 [Pedosphaera sp. Tous-C6FEB]
MKKLLILGLALASTLSSQAQLFSRDNLGSAVVGGILGGVIGHNSGRRTAEGIGIGAGTGLLLGALANDYRRQAGYDTAYVPQPTGFGFGNQNRYATTGTVLGGIAGGIIGHNSGRRTAEGVAIGAASGLVLGSVADQSLRRPVNYYHVPAATEPFRGAWHHPQAVPVVVTQPAIVTTPIASGYVAPAAPTGVAPIQAQTVIINNYYGGGSPMGQANTLFGR